MKNILDCFIKIAKNEGITITKLEHIIGASKGVLSRAIANNSDIQCKWLLNLVDNYPNYNPEWLLTGQGSMFKQVNELKPVLDRFEKKELELMELQLKGLETENKLQGTAINLYKELNDEMKFRIETLEKELAEARYSQKEPFLYSNVAESAPELISKKHK